MALSFFKIGILIYGAPDILGQIIHCWWGLPHVLDNWLFSWYDGSTSPVGATKTTSGIPKFPWGPKLSLVDLKEFYPPTWGWPDNSSIFFNASMNSLLVKQDLIHFATITTVYVFTIFPFIFQRPLLSPLFFFFQNSPTFSLTTFLWLYSSLRVFVLLTNYEP